MFSSSLYYLYPFNIEYHIFVSAMLFVMWKNIGRTIDLSSNRKRVATKTEGLTIGPILGLLALASTIGILVVYITHVEESLRTRQSAISMFYIYGIVMLVFMCSGGASGLLIYRADHIPLDTTKNPARQLDTELLFGSSIGSWLMSWCSVVAVLGSDSSPPYLWTNLVYSLLIVLEKYIQNLFIIESLYRQQEDGEREDPELLAAPEIFSVMSSLAPPYNGIINRAYETPDTACVTMENQEGSGQVYRCPRKPSEVPLHVDNKVVEPPNIKRQILKNIAVFLLMCNISVSICTHLSEILLSRSIVVENYLIVINLDPKPDWLIKNNKIACKLVIKLVYFFIHTVFISESLQLLYVFLASLLRFILLVL